MIHSLHIEALPLPGMLEKILQTSRIRGFTIRHLEFRHNEGEPLLKLQMTVESDRPQARLVTQLQKLPGVRELTALHSVAERPERRPESIGNSVALMYPL
ncbi:MAG: hypothetical protein OQL28_04855 [Sedimenticola sp.]|nr:hypothetical protein [Sedimenticola sp.]